MNASFIEHITDGSILINSLEAFHSLSREHPDNPDLLKLRADFLAGRNEREAAAGDFARAADLFLDSGRLLKAMVAKILQWKIERPDGSRLVEFHGRLKSSAHDGTPASIFIQGLDTSERLAMFSRFERVWVPADTVIKKAGDRENVLAFVVAGELKEMRYQLIDQKPQAAGGFTRVLREGDFFGDVYPLNGTPASRSYVDTLKRSELVLVSRTQLRRVCRRFPAVEGGLMQLFRVRSDSSPSPGIDKIRRGGRYRIPASMTLEIMPSAPNEAVVSLRGYSLDLSVSGMLFVPQVSGNQDPALLSRLSERAVSRSVRITIPSKDFSVSIGGEVVRTRSISVNGSRKPALGIRFAEVPPRLRGIFFALAESSHL